MICLMQAAGSRTVLGPGGKHTVRKIYLQNVIFVMIEVFALIPLTIEALGDKNPDVLTVCAVLFGVGLIGSGVCAVARAVQELKEK